LGPVLAWALAVSIRDPAFADELLWGQHAGRVLEASSHAGPVWKSAVRLPLLLLPWTAPVLAGLVRAWRSRRDPAERELVRVALWFVVLVVFFSIVPNKRDLYLLPAYPAAALLAARGLAHDVRAGRWTAGLTWSVAIGLAAVVVAGLAAGPVAAREQVELPGIAWRGAAVALPALVALVLVLRARRRRHALELVRAGALGWSAALLAVALLVLPIIDPLKSSEELGRWLAVRPERPRSIPCWGVHPEGYRFYGGVPAVDLEGELATARRLEGDDFLALVRRERLEQLPPADRAQLRVLRETQVGGREIYVLGANRPEPGPSVP
jgi:4-amino-4-deoxy-L-arabinose transferase-like glycosyltransferase